MGVHIGDDPVFIFPSFAAAVMDELLDRAKEKFYEQIILRVRNLQRKAAKIETSFSDQKSAEKANGAAGIFLLDVFVFYGTARRRSLFLEQLKRADDAITGF